MFNFEVLRKFERFWLRVEKMLFQNEVLVSFFSHNFWSCVPIFIIQKPLHAKQNLTIKSKSTLISWLIPVHISHFLLIFWSFCCHWGLSLFLIYFFHIYFILFYFCWAVSLYWFPLSDRLASQLISLYWLVPYTETTAAGLACMICLSLFFSCNIEFNCIRERKSEESTLFADFGGEGRGGGGGYLASQVPA